LNQLSWILLRRLQKALNRPEAIWFPSSRLLLAALYSPLALLLLHWCAFRSTPSYLESPMNVAPYTRRQFLSDTSLFAAFYAFAGALPFPALASPLADDPRVSQTPIADAGYAAVHKIGDGLYATISNTSKGFVTISNGGFLVGKESALLLEGFGT